jgi:hypothetical protein
LKTVFYSGNVYGSIKNINVDLQSKNGKIEIDGVLQEKSHQKIPKYSKNNLNVFTIKGNVFLATE